VSPPPGGVAVGFVKRGRVQYPWSMWVEWENLYVYSNSTPTDELVVKIFVAKAVRLTTQHGALLVLRNPDVWGRRALARAHERMESGSIMFYTRASTPASAHTRSQSERCSYRSHLFPHFV